MSSPLPHISRRLLLFDIDGTLLTSGGAGEDALKDSMRSQFGIEENLDDMIIAGATDISIAHTLLAKHNIPITSENITRFLDGYLVHLNENIAHYPGRLLPGIRELLDELQEREDCVLGLLTGNLGKGAQIKLTHFGVWHYFQLGAFADDHHDRNELGKFARSRAQKVHGTDFPPERIYVIGDTPRDVNCGKAIGARTVAIATGNYSIQELSEYSPDFLFENLSDTAGIIHSLFK